VWGPSGTLKLSALSAASSRLHVLGGSRPWCNRHTTTGGRTKSTQAGHGMLVGSYKMCNMAYSPGSWLLACCCNTCSVLRNNVRELDSWSWYVEGVLNSSCWMLHSWLGIFTGKAAGSRAGGYCVPHAKVVGIAVWQDMLIPRLISDGWHVDTQIDVGWLRKGS